MTGVLGLLALAVSYLVAAAIVNDSLLLPPLTALAMTVADLMGGSELWSHASATLLETGVAVAIAVASGLPTGLALGSSGFLRQAGEPAVDWLRSVPATALFPAMLLFFGIGSSTRIAIAAYGSFFPVVISTMYGATATDKERLRHAQRCGLGPVGRLFNVIIWEALPSILAGVRLAISAALVLVVVGEMFIGAQEGLGFWIVFHQSRYLVAEMYAVIIVTGLLGFGLNRIVVMLEGHVVYEPH